VCREKRLDTAVSTIIVAMASSIFAEEKPKR